MEEDEQRDVFNSTLVIDRKAVITSVAIDHDGSRLFLGIEDGMLEEYSLQSDEKRVAASLTARKPISARQAILSILPATSANCLAVLTADAALRFVHSDTFESKVMHKGPILAAAVSLIPGRLPTIAIATRVAMGRGIRLTISEIIPAGGQVASWRPWWEIDVPSSPGAVCLAWAGRSVIVGVGLQYMIAWRTAAKLSSNGLCKGAWRQLLSLEESTSTSTSTSISGTSADKGSIGSPAAVSLPRQDCALILGGPVGLIVNGGGEPVGNPVLLEGLPAVRALASGEGLIGVVSEDGVRIAEPGSGKWIQGLGYGEGMRPAPGQPLRAAGGGTAQSSVMVVGGRHKVWALTPVPPAEQARDLLSRGDYNGAEKLAKEGAAKGQAWAAEAYAQSALLLMHDCRFPEAAAALEQCPSEAFQPAELFPLFPQHTHGWEPHPAPLHWSLNGPLNAIEEMIVRAPVRQSSSLEEIEIEAKQAIVQYLFRARELPGVVNKDGVDTLLMNLLIDLDAAEQASAFAAVPNAVRPELVAERLQSAGWRHALATLWAAAGHAEPALQIWRELADSSTTSTSTSFPSQQSSRERTEAIEGAAGLLKSTRACPAPLVLTYLPWLLSISPGNASQVLIARQDLAASQVLPMLPIGQETRWRYLTHLIDSQPETIILSHQDASELHTELAMSLIAAIFQAAPQLQRREARREAVARHPTAPLPSSTPSLASQVSVAALVSGGRYPDPDTAIDSTEALRFRLRVHLERSQLLQENSKVLDALQGSALLEESALIHWRMGNHSATLRLLAVTLRDVGAAVCYASAFLPESDHRSLLHLLLRPGDGEEPRWEDACRVVAVLGSSLDPLEVVRAAPEDMPMPVAVALMAPLIRERMHRRRHGQMNAGLQKARAAGGVVRQTAAEELNVVIDEGRACPDCHLRLGGKVFVVVQKDDNPEQHLIDKKHRNRYTAVTNRISIHGNGGLDMSVPGKPLGNSQMQGQQGQRHEPVVLCLSCWNKRGPHNDATSSAAS